MPFTYAAASADKIRQVPRSGSSRSRSRADDSRISKQLWVVAALASTIFHLVPSVGQQPGQATSWLATHDSSKKLGVLLPGHGPCEAAARRRQYLGPSWRDCRYLYGIQPIPTSRTQDGLAQALGTRVRRRLAAARRVQRQTQAAARHPPARNRLPSAYMKGELSYCKKMEQAISWHQDEIVRMSWRGTTINSQPAVNGARSPDIWGRAYAGLPRVLIQQTHRRAY